MTQSKPATTRNLHLPLSIALLVVLMFLSACPRTADEAGNGAFIRQRGETARELPPGEYIRIGAALDLSGATKGFGQSMQKGIDLAVHQVNIAGGIYKKKLAVVYKDSEGNASFARSGSEKLIRNDNVDYLISAASSMEAQAAADVAEELEVPLVVPAATNPRVTLTEDGSVRSYVFRVCFTDDLQGRALAYYAATKLKAKRVGLVWDNSSEYSSHLREVILDELARNYPQVKVTADVSYIGGGLTTDFRPLVERATEKEFDLLILPGYYLDAVKVIRQLRASGLDTAILGGDGLGSYDFILEGGSAVEGVYLTNHFAPDDPIGEAKSFVASFKTTYEETPDTFAALAYDAVNILVSAIERANTLDRKAVAQALAETKDYPGVTGSITIDTQHNALKRIVVEKVEKGAFRYVDAILPSQLPPITGESPSE